MAIKKLRFVVLIALVLMLVLTFAACNLTQTTQQYKVTVHPNNGQVDVVWNRATNFPTLTREGYTMSGLYLDDTYTTAVTVEELKNMELTSDIDVYVKWTQNQTPQNYTVTVHPSNGGEDVIWQIGDAIPSFKKVGYVVGGFFVDENLEEPIDLSTLTELTSNMEVWVKWDDCKHSDSQWTIDDDATCTEDGKKHRTCPICEKLIEDTIPATDHAYGTVTYVWSADNTTCTATRVCSHDASHKETETVNATSVVTQNKTCTLVELTKYTATFENAAFAQQVKEDVQTAAALDHAYGTVTYEWSKDNKTCTATRVCSHDASHKETETVNATAVVTQNKTCTLVELTTYTATFENAAFAQQVKEDVQTADALDHAYGTVTYEWSKDNKTCTATRVCSHDASHKETETVNATAVVTQNKTCTLVELTKYTATFENAAFAQQVKEDVQTADALGHNKTHHALDDATCTEDGTIEYWSCDRCNKNYSDEDCTKEVTNLVISAKGHTFGDWIVETPATCTDAGVKAHKDCSVCKKHFDNDGNEIADLTISATGHDTTFHEKVDATCTTEGTLAYWSCDKCGNNFADQEGNTVITDLTINKTAHTGDWIDEVPATYWTTGTKGYQHCAVCDKEYDKNGAEIESLVIEKLASNTYAEYIAAGEDQNLTILGYISGISADKKNVWIVDADGQHGYYVYKLSNATTLEVGAEVAVKGKRSAFNGLYQLKNCTIVASGKTATQNGVTIGYTDRTDVFSAENPSLDEYQSTLAELKGVTIGTISGDSLNFTLGGKTCAIYVKANAIDSATATALKALWIEGGTADVKGFVGVYSSNGTTTYQILPVDANAITISDATKLASIKDIPEEVSADFTLPASVMDGAITWASNNTAIEIGALTEGGYPATITQGSDDVTVELTATLNGATRTFNVKVLKSGSVAIVEQTATMAYSGTTTNMSGTENNASLVGLDPSIFTVSSTKTGNNHVGLNKDGDIRIYADNTLTVSVSDGYEIISITFDFKKNGNLIKVSNGTLNITADRDGVYAIDAQKVVFTNSGSSGIQIKSITIIYCLATVKTDAEKLAGIPEFDEIIAMTVNDITKITLSDIAETWESSDPSIIEIDGTNAIVNHGNSEQNVMLTAKLGTESREFTVTVGQKLSDQAKLDQIPDIVNKNGITDDFKLNQIATSWTVPEGTTAITIDGYNAAVLRSDNDVEVVLTAHLGTATRDFKVVVLKQVVSGTSATLSFAKTDNRVSQDENKQVWSQNGITVTNNKASSASAVVDSSDPVKFYAKSEVIIAAMGNITKIEFVCSSSNYASNLNNSLNGLGTVTVSGSTVTIELTNPSQSITFTCAAQTRIKSMTVYTA